MSNNGFKFPANEGNFAEDSAADVENLKQFILFTLTHTFQKLLLMQKCSFNSSLLTTLLIFYSISSLILTKLN